MKTMKFLVGLVVSMAAMFVFMQIQKKKKISWLEPLAMPLSMFIALGAVILLHEVLPGGIAVLEWRG